MTTAALIRIANRLSVLERQAPFRFRAASAKLAVPTFDEWVSKKKFKNPKTKQDITFKTLEKVDPDKAKKVRDQYEEKAGELESGGGKSTDENDPVQIKRNWFESKAAWQKRVQENDAEVERWRKEELDRVIGPKVQDAINSALEESGEENEAKELNGPIEDLEPANVQILKRTLDKALKAHPADKVKEYDEIFGDQSPGNYIGAKQKKAKENEAKVDELMKKAEGLEGEEANKLVTEAKALMDEMEALDADIAKARAFTQNQENAKLVVLKAQHAGLIQDAWRRHESAARERGETIQKPDNLLDVADDIISEVAKGKATKERLKPRKMYKPGEKPESIKAEPEAEPAKPKEKPKIDMPAPPTDEERKPGEVWGKKPKLYAKNPKGEQGGPFKNMNEAKRWSKGEKRTTEQEAKAKKTKEQQQKAKKRKKRGFEELVTALAVERVLRV